MLNQRTFYWIFLTFSPKYSGRQHGSPPDFVKDGTLRQTASGSLVLEMELTANPAPTVDWQFNGRPLTSGGRITTNMIEKSGIYTISMEIAHVTLADQGVYKVVVKNKYGTVTTTITVSGSMLHLRGMNIIG